MSQKIIYTCDICGKEKTPKGNIRLIDFTDSKSPKGKNFDDVCLQCFNRIKGYINDIRNEENV